MGADAAPHPSTSLMPDLVEQSRDANERVCLWEGLQTTVGGIEFRGGAPSFRDNSCRLLCFAPEVLQPRRKVGTDNERYFFCICLMNEVSEAETLNDFKFPLLPPEAGALKNSADCQGGNNQSTSTRTHNCFCKCEVLWCRLQKAYTETITTLKSTALRTHPLLRCSCWNRGWALLGNRPRCIPGYVCVYCREVLLKAQKRKFVCFRSVWCTFQGILHAWVAHLWR